MITVNVHEAKTRWSALIKAVEERGESVILCRNGRPVARISKVENSRKISTRLTPHPKMSRVKINYDPTEPLQLDEWPREPK
jgi:prevent-host-death family protein